MHARKISIFVQSLFNGKGDWLHSTALVEPGRWRRAKIPHAGYSTGRSRVNSSGVYLHLRRNIADMNSAELIEELQRDTFVQLAPSGVHGIGVFAIRLIPRGCRTIFSANIGKWIRVPIKEVECLPPGPKNLVETYCLFDETDYFLPDYGFKVMDLVNYLNHADEPNVISVADGEYFEAIRDILPGEELLVNYGGLAAGMDGYKG